MKAAEAILIRWRREDPDRLLQAALRQARELAELLPELDGLRSQSAMLRQQLEIQTKRIAQLEEAPKGPNVPPTARLLLSESSRKNAPWHPSGQGANADIRAPAGTNPIMSMSPLRSNSVAVHTAVVASSRIPVRSSSS